MSSDNNAAQLNLLKQHLATVVRPNYDISSFTPFVEAVACIPVHEFEYYLNIGHSNREKRSSLDALRSSLCFNLCNSPHIEDADRLFIVKLTPAVSIAHDIHHLCVAISENVITPAVLLFVARPLLSTSQGLLVNSTSQSTFNTPLNLSNNET